MDKDCLNQRSINNFLKTINMVGALCGFLLFPRQYSTSHLKNGPQTVRIVRKTLTNFFHPGPLLKRNNFLFVNTISTYIERSG